MLCSHWLQMMVLFWAYCHTLLLSYIKITVLKVWACLNTEINSFETKTERTEGKISREIFFLQMETEELKPSPQQTIHACRKTLFNNLRLNKITTSSVN